MNQINYTGKWHPSSPLYKNNIIENYIIKDEEADSLNMRGKGPYLIDSFGRSYIRPSLIYPYYPILRRSPYYSPFGWSILQDRYNYY